MDSPTSGPNSPGGGSASQGLTRLWIQGMGWFISLLGVVSIIFAFRMWFQPAHRWPFLVVAGMILMGAAYVLARQAMAEGYVWPVPLGILACLTTTLATRGWSIIALLLLILLTILGSEADAFDRRLSEGARTAIGLWIGGAGLVLLTSFALWPGGLGLVQVCRGFCP